MKLSPFQLCLRSLVLGAVQPGLVSKEQALVRLQRLTGENYGYDIESWRNWGICHPEVSGMWPLDEDEADH